MGLESAHKGYEYQDLLTTYFIVSEMLNNSKATFIIDRKENEDDKFDDLTIRTDNLIMKRQVKYSENKVLEKSDLSSNSYDIALDNLYQSWKSVISGQKVEIRLCLAWDTPNDEDILQVLIDSSIEDEYGTGKVKYYKVDINKIWEEGKAPDKSWRRLKGKSVNIDRKEFASFLENLIIEVNLPKASLDVNNPGDLENLVISKLEDFGIGKYPNNTKFIPEVLVMLTHIVKSSRAKGKVLITQDIIFQLGLQSDYGSVEQVFRIEESVNVSKEKKYEIFNKIVSTNNRVIMFGEPGAGKSWFIQNYINYLQGKSVKVIRHYCYTGTTDVNEQERVTVNVFIANLIKDIMDAFPELQAIKPTKYGVDIAELQVLLNNIKQDTILIIDGLDHIGRIYSLHKESMMESDTQIIKVISQLQFSNKVKIVLVSQPSEEVEALQKIGYSIYNIPKWIDEEIVELINKHNIKNIKVAENKYLYEIIIDKSNGNPLYATYLINEVKGISSQNINLELLDSFPAYSNNLSSYYEYLMTKLEENDKISMVFSGASFYLSERDLSEITGMGKYVGKNLKTLKSVLKVNACTGGYAIYHESFRRFILEKLIKNEVSVEVIYTDIIKWLYKKGFYNDRKAFNNLLVILFESSKFEDVLKFINKDFIVNSVFFGNPLRAIKKNYEILLKTACKLHSYKNLIICTEIANMLYSFKFNYEEDLENYYQCIGDIHGFEYLKNALVYEGKPTLGYKQGLRACYECSKNHFIPEWKPYIDSFLEYADENTKKEIEFFKYHICANMDTGNSMHDLIEKNMDEKYVQHRKVIISEFGRRDNIEGLLKIISSLNNKVWWEQSIREYQGEIKYNLDSFLEILNNIRNMTSVSEYDLYDLEIFVEQISYFIKNSKENVDLFVNEIKETNWFYNWIIYVIKTKEIIINKSGYDTDVIEKKIIDAYVWLMKDLDCYKGEPRACDIYSEREIIYGTIIEPLKYIKSKEGWEKIILILCELSNKTTVSLQGSIMGPLSTDKLVTLLLEVTNEFNYLIIEERFKSIVTDEEKHRFYSYLAEYSMKLAIFYKKAGKIEESHKELKRGIQYLVSYSFRKDRTFSRLLDCINSVNKIDKEIGLKYIKMLKQVSDSVAYHTDGSGTQSYPHEWFTELLHIDLQVALLFLRKEFIEYDCYWILEENLEYLLTQSEYDISPNTENILYRTLPTKLNNSFIEAYIKNIETLINQNEYELAKISTAELVNRLSNITEQYIQNTPVVWKIKNICSKLGLDNNIHKITDNIKSSIYLQNKNWLKQYNEKIIERKSMDLLTEEEIFLYIKKKGIKYNDINSLIYYFEKYYNFDNSSKMFFRNIIKLYSDNYYEKDKQDALIFVFKNMQTSKEVKSYVFMYMYLTFKGNWDSRFTRIELFKEAFKNDSTVAEKCFFNYVNHAFSEIEYVFSVGDKIINSLVAIKYDNNKILQCWEELFDIINFRLSGQYEYNWKDTLINEYEMNNEEILICILLSRLKYGEATRQKWVYSGIEVLLRNIAFKNKFIKPLSWFLDNKEKFIDTSLVIILDIIGRNFTKKEIKEYGIDKKLISIYPTTSPLLNNNIEKVIGKKKKRIYIPCKYKQNSNEMIEFCNYMGKSDDRINTLFKYNVNVLNATDKYRRITRDKSFIDKYRELIWNKKYSTFVPNIYFEDCLTRCLAEEIDMFLNENVGKEDVDLAGNKLFNIASNNNEVLINQQNSIIVRPSQSLPEDIEEGVFETEIDEWVEIAKYEEECLYKKHYQSNISPENMKKIQIFEGITFNSDEQIFPYLKLPNDFSLYGNQFDYHISSELTKKFNEIIVSNISVTENIQLTFNKKLFLWLRREILTLLQIRIHCSKNGIVGLDENNEKVLKFSWWQNFYFDNEASNELIPFLTGSQLLMKKEIYDMLCKLIGHKSKKVIYKIES
jgi:nucleoside-triphosphatase THEP1